MWRSKKFADLDTSELYEAAAFYEGVLKEISNHAPIAVWGFFRDRLSELTVLQISRLAKNSPDPEMVAKVEQLQVLMD